MGERGGVGIGGGRGGVGCGGGGGGGGLVLAESAFQGREKEESPTKSLQPSVRFPVPCLCFSINTFSTIFDISHY